MAKKRTLTKKNKKTKLIQLPTLPLNTLNFLKPKNKYVEGVLYIIGGIFLAMATFDAAGNIGQMVYHKVMVPLLGFGFIFIPPLFFILAYSTLKEITVRIRTLIFIGTSFIATLSLLHLFLSREGLVAGGFFGRIVGQTLERGFDTGFSAALLVGTLLASLFALFDPHLESLQKIKDDVTEKIIEREDSRTEDKKIEKQVAIALARKEQETPTEDHVKKQSSHSSSGEKKDSPEIDGVVMDSEEVFASSYQIPPLSLLGKSGGKPSTGDIKANANIIQRTLGNFGIAVEMDEISIGPTVTRYALKPAQGVRLSKIASLQNELALALAAKSIRIEAPIPGRSLVGIEVPNTIKSKIGLGTLLAEAGFQESKKPLLVSLGKGVSGKSHFADIGKMPHALIAGTTGAGKSVTIHNVILSLLYRNGPDMLRFIMVDPKRVEMTLYKKIPHLLTPVITDPKKAVLALKWAVKEMERRYDVLQKHTVRDIDSYHNSIVKPAYKDLTPEDIENSDERLPEKMPYIVIIIDELSDIMSSYPRELEASIVRIAQMSRAVGIHLLLATQRPSVNVITGLIKANIPTRLALKVSSQIDSRTILDGSGAEKLLGYGDMLYKGEGSNEPVRIQCPFVSEEEVKSVVAYIQKNYKFELEDTISLPDDNINDGTGGITMGDDSDEDPMVEDARAVILESKKASTSYLQRRLSIGYSRAARIIDTLEDQGLVGPANGSKPREVYGATDESDEGTPNKFSD
jgi:S-DNA-T family DNA segregation ATPase FtsK/SpoIIIE